MARASGAEVVPEREVCPVIDACRSHALGAAKPFGVGGRGRRPPRLLRVAGLGVVESDEARTRRIARQRDRRARLAEGVSA